MEKIEKLFNNKAETVQKIIRVIYILDVIAGVFGGLIAAIALFEEALLAFIVLICGFLSPVIFWFMLIVPYMVAESAKNSADILAELKKRPAVNVNASANADPAPEALPEF